MNIAMIFAGGTGTRMGAGVPKQFLEVNGKPVIIYTLELFQYHPQIDKIYISILEGYEDYMRVLVEEYHITKVAGIVRGGETSQDSVYNLLLLASDPKECNPEDSVVLLHDGVRPFVSADVISENIRSVEQYGSAITSTPSFETVILSKDGYTLEDEQPVRSEAYTAQAPQSFRLGEILNAHRTIRVTPDRYFNVVDSCTLMRKIGKNVRLVQGNRGNIKVTTPQDVYLFRALLEFMEHDQTFGLGLTNRIQAKINLYRKHPEQYE